VTRGEERNGVLGLGVKIKNKINGCNWLSTGDPQVDPLKAE
jgi:hypothetical protein